MLNISPERINHLIEESKYDAFASLKKRATSDWMIKIFSGLLFLAIIALFLPWTQNIRAKGYVTTLDPESRPQMPWTSNACGICADITPRSLGCGLYSRQPLASTRPVGV